MPRLAAAVLPALLLLAGCGGDSDRAPDAGTTANVPEVAPAYSAMTLDGDSVSLAALRGEVVLLNVWATWCAPCRKEIPELQALHEAHADEGLRVVGVTVDARGAEADVRQFAEQFGMTYDIWWDPDQTAVSRFGAMGVPLSVLIDRQGRIRWSHLGPFTQDDPALMAALREALDSGPSGLRG